MKEKQVENYLRAQCIKHGAICLKCTGTPGLPDRAVIYGGETYWVEVKQEKGQIGIRQHVLHAEMKKRGVYVDVMWSCQDVDKFISQKIAQEKKDNHDNTYTSPELCR